MAERRPTPKQRRGSVTPNGHELAGALIEADRLLAGISDEVAECLARQRWADLEAEVTGYAKRLRVAPIAVFDAALVRIYVKRALTTADPIERRVCRSEVARLLGGGAHHQTLKAAIGEIRAAVRERDAADALTAFSSLSAEVH